MRSPLAFLLSLPVRFYRRIISPLKPKTCRFEPTCSNYALEALHRHGGIKGSWLTAKRLCRCHPFCEPGFDPVPPRSQPAATDDEGRHPNPDARTDVTPHPSSDLDQA